MAGLSVLEIGFKTGSVLLSVLCDIFIQGKYFITAAESYSRNRYLKVNVPSTDLGITHMFPNYLSRLTFTHLGGIILIKTILVVLDKCSPSE